MDDPYQRRKHDNPPGQNANPTSNRFQGVPQATRSPSYGSGERFRPPPIDTSSPVASRGMSGAGNYNSYYQEPAAAFTATNLSAAAINYGQSYSHDARAQPQGFGSYQPTNIMYNIAHPGAQPAVYDAPPFGPRQSAAMQMVTTPDVASAYFSPEATATSASNLAASGQGSSAAADVYQTTPSMAYSSVPGSNQAAQQTPGSVDVSMGGPQDYTDGALEEKWMNYQNQLGSVFRDIACGSLESASDTLLSISEWLLTQVVDLGLTTDDASLHSDRIRLWNDFNHAWLALAHQQRELTASGQQLSRSQRLLSEATIRKLGDELIRLCDDIERHGLVDYQYGVWEEQIESVLEDCLNQVEDAEESR